MIYFDEKIKRRIAQIETSIYAVVQPVTTYRVQSGKAAGMEAVGIDDSAADWQDFTTDQLWGGYDTYQWFRTTLEIPDSFAGRPAAFVLNTDHEAGISNLLTAEYTAYVDGALNQGLDAFHHELLITENAKGGKRYNLALLGFSGMTEGRKLTTTRLVAIDLPTRAYYYNLRVALESSQVVDQTAPEFFAIQHAVNESMKLVDFRVFMSDEYYASIVRANEYLEKHLYEAMSSTSQVIVDAIGHAHIDVAWLWQISHTREKAARTFATADKLMDSYPDYRFIQSQPQLYEYLRADYPELYDKVLARIKQGRWEAEGGMWVEADCNLISGESMVRQFLIGKAFFRDELGVDSKILWLPDVFGYSAAMPQILQKCGVPYFMTTKISWNQFNDVPVDTFYLVGIDGSRVLTHFVTTPDVRTSAHNKILIHKKTYNGFLAPWPVKTAWDNYKQKDINSEIMVSFGFGDGGGGPSMDMLEMADRLKDFPAMPKVRQLFAREFFENLERSLQGKAVPEWRGELYLEYHRGTYTSQAKNKKFNRQAEFLYLNTELFAVANMLTGSGSSYPTEGLERGWKEILCNQFHDIIPGSSIGAVYKDSTESYSRILGDGREMLNTAISGIVGKININHDAVVVFNPNSASREGLVRLPSDSISDVHFVSDNTGHKVPVQHLPNGEAVFFAAALPQKGYKTYYTSDKPVVATGSLNITTGHMENKYYKILLDDSGTITSIVDKFAGREVLAGRGNVLQAFEDKPMSFDAWDIDIFFTEKMWEVDDVQSIEVLYSGAVCGAVRIKRRFMSSTITQDIVIYADVPVIDFKTTIDWKQEGILLKAAFPVDINAERATYEIQYGHVERPTHRNTSWDMARFEVCAHKWVDLSEGDYGVSLLNDCKYGHDILGNQIRLTLLKSAIYPDPNADKEMHEFTYQLYPHRGDFRKAHTTAMGYALNNPPFGLPVAPQKGVLPHSMAFVSLDNDNMIVEAVKKAEREDAVILRLYEHNNTRGKQILRLPFEIAAAYECNMLEENIAELPVDAANPMQVCFDFTPFEIKTIKLLIKS